jgi:tetratricopeptide (TPR) repeat protein
MAANPRGAPDSATALGSARSPDGRRDVRLPQPVCPEAGPFRYQGLLIVGLIIVLLAAYWPALNGGLLWDDDAHVTRPALRSLEGLGRIWTELGATQQYYPLLHSAFWLEHRLWGDAVAGYHLMNLMQHAAAAWLVMLLMRRLGLPGAELAALIFALHPVAVESVAWISEQKNTLSAVLFLSAALLYLDFDRSRRRRTYALAFGLFVLALLTKTVTATLPAVLLVLFWWQRGRLSLRQDVLPLVPWFALGLASGLFTAWVEHSLIGARGAEFDLTTIQRGLLAGRALCFYFWKLLWPVDLVFIYPRWTIDPTVWWQYLFPAAVVLLGAVLLWRARRQRGPLAALLLYGGMLFPALGFLNVYPFLFSYVADHFQYLASLAVIAPAAGILTRLTATLPPPARGCLAAVLLLTLGGLTRAQTWQYRDAATLYRTVLRDNPDCWLAYNNLGNLASRSPEGLNEAASHYAEVVRLRPDFADGHFNLANTLAKFPDRRAEAIAHYETALRLQPDHADASNHLGNLLARDPAQLPRAVACFEAALRSNPAFAEAHCNLGNALSRLPERRAEALAHYAEAIRLRPDFTDAHYNLAVAYARLPERREEAMAAFNTAIRLQPDFAEAHFGLGVLLYEQPARRAEADEHLDAALRLRPDWTVARRHIERLRSR